MALSELPRTRSNATAAQKRAREEAVRVETVRRNFDRVAGEIGAARSLAPDTESMSDLDLFELATALSTTKT